MNRILLAIILLSFAGFTMPGGANSYGNYENNQISVILETGYTIEEVNDTWGTETIIGFPEDRLYLLYAFGVEDIEQFSLEMSSDPAVSSAQPNFIHQSPEIVRQMVIAVVGGSWEDFHDQGLTERIGLDEAHLISRGEGVTIAVLDTGIDPTHDIFQDNLSPNGFDYLNNDFEPWEEFNGIDDDGDGLTDGGFGHGSMVAGIVALVAPESTILPIRIINDEGKTNAFLIARGLLHAIQQDADIINMSFGVPLDVDIIDLLIQRMDDLEIIAIAGAGNENRESPCYFPAGLDGVFMVTALDSLDVKAEFADFHERVLISAPGVGVRSAYPDNNWGIGSGCSFATPLVSGEAALIRSLSPGMDCAQMESHISNSVDPIYDIPGNELYFNKLGSGRINLPSALTGLSTGVDSSLPAFDEAVRLWPNPAQGQVRFEWTSLSNQAPVKISILDVTGRRIRSLEGISGETLIWDGLDHARQQVPCGVYYAHITSNNRSFTRSIMYIR